MHITSLRKLVGRIYSETVTTLLRGQVSKSGKRFEYSVVDSPKWKIVGERESALLVINVINIKGDSQILAFMSLKGHERDLEWIESEMEADVSVYRNRAEQGSCELFFSTEQQCPSGTLFGAYANGKSGIFTRGCDLALVYLHIIGCASEIESREHLPVVA